MFNFVIMNGIKFLSILVLLGMMPLVILGQSAHRHLRNGDKAYKQEMYDVAEESYRKSVEQSPSAKGTFNLGNTVYQQDRFEEAVQHYQQTVNSSSDDVELAEALYNLGTAQLKNGQLEEAVESYKSAVRANPEDDEIRQNLYVAKLLRRQEQQQEQKQEQQQEDNQQSDEENQDQQNQDDQQGESQEGQPSSDSEIDNQGGESPNPEEAQELSKEDAEKLLQVIENEEKSVQEKLRKISGNKKKPKKDW